MSVETRLKFIEEGIVYDELSDEDKEEYENTFTDEDGQMPESIGSGALNEWIFNADTIREVLNILMTQGLTVDYGQKIGKTIIFAKNHRHAEKILEINDIMRDAQEIGDRARFLGVVKLALPAVHRDADHAITLLLQQ